MAAPYICLYINIYCASQIGLLPKFVILHTKAVVNIPWKLVSLSLLKWKDGYCKISREQRRITENLKLSFARSSALVDEDLVSSPPDHLLLRPRWASCNLWEVLSEPFLERCCCHLGLHFRYMVEGGRSQRTEVSIACVFPDEEIALLGSRNNRSSWRKDNLGWIIP